MGKVHFCECENKVIFCLSKNYYWVSQRKRVRTCVSISQNIISCSFMKIPKSENDFNEAWREVIF